MTVGAPSPVTAAILEPANRTASTVPATSGRQGGTMSNEQAAASLSVVGSHEGEVLPAGPVLNRVLEDGSTTQGRLGVVECRIPPAWPGPPQHLHQAHDESFFVLTGHVRFVSGSTEHILSPGGLFLAGIGTPHTFGNPDADEPASLLLTVTPERYVGYFRELQDLSPGPDGLLDPAEIRALMVRYATVPFPAAD